MKTFKTDAEIKEHVRLLKNFYMALYSYLTVVAATTLVWLMAGAGYYWPIWIVVIWGTSLFFKASKLEVIDGAYYKLLYSIRDRLPFLKPGWEDQKFNELKKGPVAKTAAPASKQEAPKPNPVKQDKDVVQTHTQTVTEPVPAKETVVKKTVAKKPVKAKPAAAKAKTSTKKAPAKTTAKKPAVKKTPSPKK